MGLKGREGSRGAMTPKLMLIAGCILLVIAAGIFLWTQLVTKPAAKAAATAGKAGHETKTLPSRSSGINLPIADQAADAPSNPALEVDVPVDIGATLDKSKPVLDKRLKEVAVAAGGDAEGTKALDAVVTLKVDRDLPYKNLVQAVIRGQGCGFSHFRIACIRNAADPSGVGYLRIDLPTEGQPKTLLFRMVADGSSIRYILGPSKEVSNLASAMVVLTEAAKLHPDWPVTVMPSLTLSVQRVADGLNAVTKAGFKSIVFARPPGEYDREEEGKTTEEPPVGGVIKD